MSDVQITYHEMPEIQPPAFKRIAGEFFGDLLAAAREGWAEHVWQIFDMYRETPIFTVRKWFLSFTVRVKHCAVLVQLLVGPRPQQED